MGGRIAESAPDGGAVTVARVCAAPDPDVALTPLRQMAISVASSSPAVTGGGLSASMMPSFVAGIHRHVGHHRHHA